MNIIVKKQKACLEKHAGHESVPLHEWPTSATLHAITPIFFSFNLFKKSLKYLKLINKYPLLIFSSSSLDSG